MEKQRREFKKSATSATKALKTVQDELKSAKLTILALMPDEALEDSASTQDMGLLKVLDKQLSIAATSSTEPQALNIKGKRNQVVEADRAVHPDEMGASAFVDPKLLRVLRTVDAKFDVTKAVDLAMKLKKWYYMTMENCCSGTMTVVMKR